MEKEDKLRIKKEYYFRQYFNQAEMIRDKRERIAELNLTKKEIQENPVFIGAINYDSMPHNPNVNPDAILDKLIKQEDKIENIDNRIDYLLQQLNKDLQVFESIDTMFKEFTENQRQVFILTYRDKMRNIEIAYTLGLTERAVKYNKREILKRADFIQED